MPYRTACKETERRVMNAVGIGGATAQIINTAARIINVVKSKCHEHD